MLAMNLHTVRRQFAAWAVVYFCLCGHLPSTLAQTSTGIGTIAQTKNTNNVVESTWTDPTTGLMWTKQDNGSDITWQQAVDYCENLQLAGHSDWRLPTMSQLATIYDPSVNIPGLCCSGSKPLLPGLGAPTLHQVTWHVKGNLQLSGDLWSKSRTGDSSQAGAFAFADMGKSVDLKSAVRIWDLSATVRALCVRRTAAAASHDVAEVPLSRWAQPTAASGTQYVQNHEKVDIPVDVSITPYIRQGLTAKAFTARSSGVDLNGDGIPELIALSGCGASNCEFSLSDGVSHKEIYSFMQTDPVHILPARTNGYHDLLQDSASNLYVNKFNGEKYEFTDCYRWLASDGSQVPQCCPDQRRKLERISCRTFQPISSEEQQEAAKAKEFESAVRSLGFHSGMSQPQVKAILMAHGYTNPDYLAPARPWVCASNGWKNGRLTTACVAQKGAIHLAVEFEFGIAHLDPDTGEAVVRSMDRLFYAQFGSDNVGRISFSDPQYKNLICNSLETDCHVF